MVPDAECFPISYVTVVNRLRDLFDLYCRPQPTIFNCKSVRVLDLDLQTMSEKKFLALLILKNIYFLLLHTKYFSRHFLLRKFTEMQMQ